MKRFKAIPSVYVFFIKDGNILLGRRCNTDFEDGNYGAPAGHVEAGESVRAAACREALEEVGVRIDSDDLECAHISYRKSASERVDFFFHAKKWVGEPNICEPHLCDDLQWFALDVLPANTIAHERQAIGHYLKGIIYSEFGWEDAKHE